MWRDMIESSLIHDHIRKPMLFIPQAKILAKQWAPTSVNNRKTMRFDDLMRRWNKCVRMLLSTQYHISLKKLGRLARFDIILAANTLT